MRICSGLIALLVFALTSACTRTPRAWECPDCAVGDVVITEIRGPQTGEDSLGQWIELHNRTGATIDLAGATMRMVRPDGTGEAVIRIRARESLIDAGGYFVLGSFDQDSEPTHVDYGYRADFDGALYEDALLELAACGEVIDAVVYHDLPRTGTLGFDGAQDPDATANDDEAAWCGDTTVSVADGGPVTELGVPGTPGERNRPCP